MSSPSLAEGVVETASLALRQAQSQASNTAMLLVQHNLPSPMSLPFACDYG